MQHEMLYRLEFDPVDLHTEAPVLDFMDWPPTNLLHASHFGNYAVEGSYSMPYPPSAVHAPAPTMQSFHPLASTSHHSNNFSSSDSLSDASDSDSDSDVAPYTSTPSTPIPMVVVTKPKPKPKSKSKAKSKPRMRKPKEPKPMRIFECAYGDCTKVFSRQFNLDQHNKTHSNERPFVCEYKDCAKAFIRRADLVRHDRTHSGITPFSCNFEGCKETFSRTEARQRHYAKAHSALYQKSPEYAKRLERSRKTPNL
ncbi:hypothetical protein BGX26_000743 [Mortierella sp. AD094]|nr:hypothetical protein BGX26_000743 [Mortierella sp. AD094]